MSPRNAFVDSARGVFFLVTIAAAAGCTAPSESAPGEDTGYNVDAVWSAPPCGAVLATWDGTSARSNGGDTGTGNSCAGTGTYGLQYQCVELVMRHFKTHWGLRWYGNAADLLNNAPTSQVDVHYNGDTAHPPVPGDMIVWNDTKWGHVALVTTASSTSLTIMQQNVWGAGGTAKLPISGGRVHGPSGWGWADPHGWAHAKANGGSSGGGGGSTDPCAHATYGGRYCGQSTQYGFGPGQTDALYDCENHITASKTSCAAGCKIMPPGQEDTCRVDPCKSAQYGGKYCGQSTQYGFANGVTNWLYDCQNHVTATHVACSNGCEVMPPGQEDRCK